MIGTDDVMKDLVDSGLRAGLLQAGNEQLGSDVAMPCFSLAGEMKQSPQAIAETIASNIEHPHIEKVEAIAGYVNIWFKTSYLVDLLLRQGADRADFGNKPANNQTVIIDYVSQNLAKPLSVGHLRNALQGRGLKNLYASQGYTVVTDNHVGDWGTVFGMWVVGFLKFSSDDALEKGGNKELGRVYVEMRKALKSEEEVGKDELKNEVQEWLLRLESGDEQAWQYHQRFKEISLKDAEGVLERLNIHFDENLGEAFYYQQARDLIADLQERGIAQAQADGSIIVNLDSQGIDTPLLLQKSNGALLYASSDVATLKYRQDRWQPHLVIYVVGAEQQFHFKQLFALNDMAKLTDAELVHHWYGLVEEIDSNGNRRKMSSREGAVFLEDVLETAIGKADKQAKDEVSDADVERVAYGAITFREFLQSHHSNVLFDWDEMFSLSGKSGPYVQYAVVRLNSIIGKAAVEPAVVEGYDWNPEHKLLQKLIGYPELLDEALKTRELSKLAFYSYDLAKELNRYYESTVVLDSDASIQACRLWLMQALANNMRHCLAILGIDVPSKM